MHFVVVYVENNCEICNKKQNENTKNTNKIIF